MDVIKIKHREFTVTERIDEKSVIASLKNKQYLVTSYDPKSQEGQIFSYSLKRISNSPIVSPKLIFVDKKSGYIVREYVAAENVMDIISREDLSEDVYDQLFKNAYFARVSSMTLDYSPNAWGIKDGKLYYLAGTFTPYVKEKDLVDKYLRLWFNTRELAEFLKNNGVFYDKSRTKDEYSVNKQIVLMACKYYR